LEIGDFQLEISSISGKLKHGIHPQTQRKEIKQRFRPTEPVAQPSKLGKKNLWETSSLLRRIVAAAAPTNLLNII
jgi:hypothetical protein